MYYITRYKYKNNVCDTEEELIATFGYLSHIGIDWDFESVIKYYVYSDIEKEDDKDVRKETKKTK